MASKALPSPEVLRQLLRYEPETGKLFWLPRPREMFDSERIFLSWNAKLAGHEAFTANDGQGYRVGRVHDRLHKAHRVGWCIATGAWPADELDHINGDRSDNRMSNLRQADHGQNLRNRRSNIGSTSQYLGVSWRRDCAKWCATIQVGGRKRHLGVFCDEAEAAEAYDKAAAIHFGQFARLNFPEVTACRAA